MSRTLKIVLPEPAADQLQSLASAADEPASRLAAQMVRAALARAAKVGAVAPPRSVVAGARKTDRRAQWLQPPGGDPSWRARMWSAIVALHRRYPRALGALKHGWWADTAHTETLGALATWRAQLDESADDPREELAFHAELADYALVLRQEGGGVTKAWKPAAPPDEWARG
jgi:hypothetical protein